MALRSVGLIPNLEVIPPCPKFRAGCSSAARPSSAAPRRPASVSVSAAAESADAATLAGAGKSSAPLHGDIRDVKHVRDPDAGEPELRPLLRLAPGRARLRRPLHHPATPAGCRSASSPPPRRAPLRRVTSTPVPVAAQRRRVRRAQPPSVRDGRAELRRHRPLLGVPARRLVRRPDERLAVRQGRPDHAGLPDPQRHPVPLRPRRRLHHRRRVPLLGARATGPNRTYLWSGTINADQEDGSFVAFTGGDELGRFLPWQSYPETLQHAGLTWKVYQGTDNYGDNGAQYFKTFAELDPSQGGTAPAPGSNVYYDNGLATVPEPLDPESRQRRQPGQRASSADVVAGTLPQVSWVVTNQPYSEHPDGAPTDGGVLHRRGTQALQRRPRRLQLHPRDHQLRRERRPVRPRAAAVAPAPGPRDEFYWSTGSPAIPPARSRSASASGCR